MEIIFSLQAKDDLIFWKKSGNKGIQKKITELLESIKKEPFAGLGKPEALQYELKVKWSRRINSARRLVYEVKKDQIWILTMRGHYK